MATLSERFELRLDEATLENVDAWRSRQADVPSRAEAIRRLIEKGLGSSEGPIRLSPGEVLIASMLCDLLTNAKLKTNIDPKFVREVLVGGHLWGLEWEYHGLFHGHVDRPEVVREVVEIVDMWDFLESGYEALDRKDKDRVAKEAAPFGSKVHFTGFDGNNESEHFSVVRFLVNDLDRFARFKGRELNSHSPSIDAHQRMLNVFLPMRKTLAGGQLSASQIIDILKARLHPERRKQ